MKSSKRIAHATIFCIVFGMGAPLAYAGNEQGHIQANWNVYGDGYLFFDLSGVHASSPCSFPERWALNTTTSVGKSWYAAFLMAYASGKRISLGGNGACVHGNTEEVTNFAVLD